MKILFLHPMSYNAAKEEKAENVLSVYEDDDYYNYEKEENEAYESNYRSMMGFTDDYYLYWNTDDDFEENGIIDRFHDFVDDKE